MASVRLSPMSSSIHVHDTDIGGGGDFVWVVKGELNTEDMVVTVTESSPTVQEVLDAIENEKNIRCQIQTTANISGKDRTTIINLCQSTCSVENKQVRFFGTNVFSNGSVEAYSVTGNALMDENESVSISVGTYKLSST